MIVVSLYCYVPNSWSEQIFSFGKEHLCLYDIRNTEIKIWRNRVVLEWEFCNMCLGHTVVPGEKYLTKCLNTDLSDP